PVTELASSSGLLDRLLAVAELRVGASRPDPGAEVVPQRLLRLELHRAVTIGEGALVSVVDVQDLRSVHINQRAVWLKLDRLLAVGKSALEVISIRCVQTAIPVNQRGHEGGRFELKCLGIVGKRSVNILGVASAQTPTGIRDRLEVRVVRLWDRRD